MPQDTTPISYLLKDTAIEVSSIEEYYQLPDSLKSKEILTLLEEKYNSDHTSFGELFFYIAFFGFMAFTFYKILTQVRNKSFTNTPDPHSSETAPLLYKGKELKFPDDDLDKVCSKYNSYYLKLNFAEKKRFTGRLKEFLRTKDFYIYADKGYKEMPILISASAIQITFGLDEYKLSHFKNIIIHPDAYLMDNPLRVLMGNVQGNSITLSWKHFLADYQNPTDGKNVGLHEMAHALQVQYLFTKHNRTNDFKEDFEHYDRVDDEVLKEKFEADGLFDKYALNNKNELWATSVELFFERPADLKLDYPELYDSIKLVLNQDPIKMM